MPFYSMLSTQGKYGEADPLYLRVIDVMEKALGPDHPNVAVCLHNRALLLGEQVRDLFVSGSEVFFLALLFLRRWAWYVSEYILTNTSEDKKLLRSINCVPRIISLKALLMVK